MDDVTLLMIFASALIILIIALLILRQKSAAENQEPAANNQREGVRGGPRRAAVGRGNVRNRFRGGGQQGDADEGRDAADPDDDEEVEAAADDLFNDPKLGAKKRAKMEAKAEKKAMREAEQRGRDEKKKQDAKKEAERQKEIEIKEAEEEKSRELERRAQEEKERQEQEEYMKLKEAFSIESEGFDENEGDDEHNTLKSFVQYIMDTKVVILEDLAVRFKLKIHAAINRIEKLQEDKILTGVFDDRGKFIFLSNSELEAVAKFIRQRGRVSIADLASASNSLINLTPVNTVSAGSS